MDKRTETLSARISADLLAQIQAIALANDTTVSDLACQCISEFVAKERLRYERLSAAFGCPQDLQGKRDG